MKKVSRFEYAITEHIQKMRLSEGLPPLPDFDQLEPKTAEEERQERIDNLMAQASRLRVVR